MEILVTGSAGFIGFHLCEKMIKSGHNVVGIDNLNEYYSLQLKQDRLSLLKQYPTFIFHNIDICDYDKLEEISKKHKFDIVINLAAQAGVRYSIDNPRAYQKSNIEGFINILELCRNHGILKLVYASSSSVYGNSDNEFFSENDFVDLPVSLYAATKKSNELMAHVYSHLFGISTIGLRFFTVYGPWGRPDMAYFKFLDSLKNNKCIQVYNNGDLLRDFTYIDDIINGIISAIDYCGVNQKYEIFNLGNNKPVKLLDFITTIEEVYGKNFQIEYLGMQDGDVYKTAANINLANNKLNYLPKIEIREGLINFVNWYKSYYKC